MNDVLTRICNDKKQHVSAQKVTFSLQDLKAKIQDIAPPLGFINKLQQTFAHKNIPLVAEVKKASPSKGIIRQDFDPVKIAKIYQASGASCLSVLTDTPYFQGEDIYLQNIRGAVKLPLLRKDFMVDVYQIYESRALGADAVLIIMAALNDSQVKELYDASQQLGMDVLIEVHDQYELERALTLMPAMIGVNSRNLKTLEVDIQTAHTLIQQIPESIFKIAESGIGTHEDICALQAIGAQGFLVGESLMREEDIANATKKLLGVN